MLLPFRGTPASLLGLLGLLALCSTAAAAVAGDGPSILSQADIRAAFPTCAVCTTHTDGLHGTGRRRLPGVRSGVWFGSSRLMGSCVTDSSTASTPP